MQGAVDIVVQLVLDDQADRAPFSVAATGCLGLHLMIGAGNRFEQLDLVGIEQSVDDEKAVSPKLCDLIGGCHEGRQAGIPSRRTTGTNVNEI